MIEPRRGAKTVKFVDEYCQWYRKLFSDVRSFEAFKYLHIGCISELKRKTLPEIAKLTGLDNQQGLHHFLTTSPWDVELGATRFSEVGQKRVTMRYSTGGDRTHRKSSKLVKLILVR